jgi:penicillin G amidase
MALGRARVARLLVVVLAVAVILSLIWWWPREPLPPLDGRIPLSGLHAPVEVRFDRFAIPHVRAHSDADAWRAVGYLQARDRLWQMELYRRAASGRLAEMLGADLVAIDERFLTLGLRRAAQSEWDRAAPDVRRALAAYADGANAAIVVGRWKRPVELQLLGINPEPWTPVDSLAIGKLFAWRLGENHAAELLRYALAQRLGPTAYELLGGKPDPAPGSATLFDRERNKALPIPLPPGLEWLSSDHHAASNSWVLSGARTASGRPLLANDPHLVLEMPSVWWEVQVSVDAGPNDTPLDVSGVTIPGIPFIIIGHNARIGWGVTNSGADVQDFYVEGLDASRERYLDHAAWVPLALTHYDIRVKGQKNPLAFTVRETAHGPVMNADDWWDPLPGAAAPPDAPNTLNETVLALKWDAVREGETAGAFNALARAGDWTSFLSAVRRFSAPSQNFAYADVDGNIGSAMSGRVPVRSSGDGTRPAPGWTGESVWERSIDPAQLPARLNPPEGQIVAANNEGDPQFPLLITRDWVAPFRARRITQLLGDRRGLDVAAMIAMQSDIVSLSADSLLNAIADEVPAELQHWDRRLDARSTSTFYEAFEEALWRRTFADDMPPGLYDRFYRYAANERLAGIHLVINDPRSPWFDDRTTPNIRETRDDIVRLAAADARAALTRRFGPASTWEWDRIHAVTFSHALAGGGRLLNWFFSRGPVRVGGDGMTIDKTTTNLRRPYETSEGASYRQILDVGAWDGSLAVNTTGQSGHPASPHYFDQNPLWQQGRYHSVPFSRAAVEAATASRVDLIPER